MSKKEKGRLPPFVPLLVSTLDSRAWREMSHGAQMLYVALRRRVPKGRNRAYLSYRQAIAELRSSKRKIAEWFRDLEHYGFIVLAQHGSLGVEGCRWDCPRRLHLHESCCYSHRWPFWHSRCQHHPSRTLSVVEEAGRWPSLSKEKGATEADALSIQTENGLSTSFSLSTCSLQHPKHRQPSRSLRRSSLPLRPRQMRASQIQVRAPKPVLKEAFSWQLLLHTVARGVRENAFVKVVVPEFRTLPTLVDRRSIRDYKKSPAAVVAFMLRSDARASGLLVS